MRRAALILALCFSTAPLAAEPTPKPRPESKPVTRTVSPDGKFSVVLPDGWTSGPRGRFVPGDGAATSLAIAVTYKPFDGKIEALLQTYEPSMKAGQMERRSRKQKKVDGAAWTTDVWERDPSKVQLTIFGRSAVTNGRGVVLTCGSTPERQPPADAECALVLGTFHLGEAPDAPAGMQRIGADGWYAFIPEEWQRNPDAPTPIYTSPAEKTAPILVNVMDRKINAERGDPKTPQELVLAMSRAMGATVDAKDLEAATDEQGLAFRFGVSPQMERAFFMSRASIRDGKALALVCGSRGGPTYDADRVTCQRVVDSVRWEK